MTEETFYILVKSCGVMNLISTQNWFKLNSGSGTCQSWEQCHLRVMIYHKLTILVITLKQFVINLDLESLFRESCQIGG